MRASILVSRAGKGGFRSLAMIVCIAASLSCWTDVEPVFAQTAQTRQGVGSEDPTLSDSEVYTVRYVLPLMLIELKLSETARVKGSDSRTRSLAERIRTEFSSLRQELEAAARAHGLSYQEGLEKSREEGILKFSQLPPGPRFDKKYCDNTSSVLVEMELALGGPVHAEDLKSVVDRTKQAVGAYEREAQALITEIR